MLMNSLNNQKSLHGNLSNKVLRFIKITIKNKNKIKRKDIHMKFAFSSNAYTNYSLKESIADISKIGYQGVEIMCDSPHAYPLLLNSKKISDIKNELSNNNIQISNLNAFTLFAIGDTYHPSWIEEDLNYRRLRIDHTINCLKLAKD